MKNDAIEEREKPADVLTLLEGLQAWKVSVEVDGEKFDGEYVVDPHGIRVRLAGTSWLDAIWSHRVENPQVVARDLLRDLANKKLDLAETRYVLVRVDPRSTPTTSFPGSSALKASRECSSERRTL